MSLVPLAPFFAPLRMTQKLFAALNVYHDRDSSRSAALNMAIDEALFETATIPTIRFYQWDHPALSFGYSGKFAAIEKSGRDTTRRWTGGGVVQHGNDLTYSIAVPTNDPAFDKSSLAIYETVHRAICSALTETGYGLELARESTPNTQHPTPNAQCFANPVRADVMLNGQKIAGAAQRRTKRGLLQQGSIQAIQLPADFQMRFASQLSGQTVTQFLEPTLLDRAQELARQKYGTEIWLRKR